MFLPVLVTMRMMSKNFILLFEMVVAFQSGLRSRAGKPIRGSLPRNFYRDPDQGVKTPFPSNLRPDPNRGMCLGCCQTMFDRVTSIDTAQKKLYYYKTL